MDVEVRLLRSFVAVAGTLHFGRAAELLFISQPALSQQIRKLEADLRTTLFDRDRRSVALTAAGRELLGPAQAAVAAAEAFAQAAKWQSRQEHGELVVGFHTRWPDNFLPRTLRAYRQRRPDVDVALRQYEFTDTSAGLRAADTDCALLHLPLDPASLRWQVVATDDRVVMIAEDHPLAGRAQVTVRELVRAATAWAVPSDNDPVWRDFWSAAPERAEAGGANVDRVGPESAEALFQTVASGRAVAITYAAMQRMYSPPGVLFVPVSDLAPAELAVAWREHDTRPAVQVFVATVCAAAGHDPDA